MEASPAMQAAALERFGTSKTADLAGLLSSVAGAPIGGYIGHGLGERYLRNPRLGAMIGTIGGGVLSRAISDAASGPPPGMPQNPYALDPTSEDIPPWALASAQLVRPALGPGKTAAVSSSEGLRDSILGDLGGPIYPILSGASGGGGVSGALRHLAGSSAGIAAGGLLGHGLGHLLPQTDIWGIPLSTILSGLGATIGGVKGLEAARYGLKPALTGR